MSTDYSDIRNLCKAHTVTDDDRRRLKTDEWRKWFVDVCTNATMRDYRVPRFADTPPIELVLLDRTDLPSAGAGETPIVGVAPAIGSAARVFGRVDTALPVRLA